MARKWLDRTQSVVEYALTIPFLLSAAQLPFIKPLGTDGFVVVIFGGHVALVIYAVWFAFISLGLIYSKVRKHDKAHKHFLMAIYLTTIFTAILSWYLAGFGQGVDDLVLGAIAGWCWMRWKLKTEYVDFLEVYEPTHTDVEHFKKPPPLP